MSEIDEKLEKIEEKFEKEFDDLKSKNDRIKKIAEELVKRYTVLTKDSVRQDLASAIQASAEAFAKINDESIKKSASGLAHAAILKLHEEINKL